LTIVNTAWLTTEVEGDGSPILFVHGLGGSSNTFQPLLGSLNGFRCIRPDSPGSGRSKLPHEKLSISLLVKTLIETARTLGACPVHLVGHSMGTHVCQHIAAQIPDQILSMTLFGPIFEPQDAARVRLGVRAQTARNQGMAVIADAMVEAGLSSATKASNPIAAAFVRESHMRQDAEGFAQSCEALAGAKAADVRVINCPTLLVTGEEDGVAPPSAAHALAEKIKGAKTKILDRCGHWTPIERPVDCAKLLSDFLRETRH
jgi:3-oxoadipate enol-lactonase